MRSHIGRILLAAVVLLTAATLVEASNPGNPTGPPTGGFARRHPRRYEVNRRVANQRARISQGAKTGQLTSGQARQLRSDDRAIKQQEHADVKTNGGYLTKPEQKQLNQEENATSTLIHDEKHPAAK
jgi:hypothetical protein